MLNVIELNIELFINFVTLSSFYTSSFVLQVLDQGTVKAT